MTAERLPATATSRVRTATHGDVDELASVLAQAFDNDPVLSWLVRQDARRAEGLRSFFRACLTLLVPHGLVDVSPDDVGVALWAPPGTWPPGEEFKPFHGDLEEAFGPDRADRSFDALEVMDAQHPEVAHYHLPLLGVDPAHQGRGVGSELLAARLHALDAEEMPAYLEATSPRNRELYLRHGFEVIDELPLPQHGPPVWLMWREPHADRL